MSQGALGTVQGIGADKKTTIGGFVVVQAGYSAAFLTLGAIAALAFVKTSWWRCPRRASARTLPLTPIPTRGARAAISP